MAPSLLRLLLFTALVVTVTPAAAQGGGLGPTWCVARSDASYQALQTALDYACSAGADCTPIQTDGLCFLPNTIQAHASYAFNSYYQRKGMAPGSCGFAGTSTVAKTDPSYGSCVYPSSMRSAGGSFSPTTPTPTTTTNNPFTPTTPDMNGGSAGLNPGLTPGGMSSTLPNTDDSKASEPVLTLTSLVISSLIALLFV